MENLGQCQINGCDQKAKYALYQTLLDGSKEWVYVCKLHEGIIGNENLKKEVRGHGDRKSKDSIR